MKRQAIPSLPEMDGSRHGREIDCPSGAAEAMLLGRCSPTRRREQVVLMSFGALVAKINLDRCH